MSGLLERGVAALERIAAALEYEIPEVLSAGVQEEPAPEGKPKSSSTKASSKEASPSSNQTAPASARISDVKADRETVRDVLKMVHKHADAQTARDVLAQFGVSSISALDESQYADVITAAEAALA